MKQLLIFFSVAGILIFNSCSKVGEDDPWISFRSRAARVAGDWTVKSYTYIKKEDGMGLMPKNNYTMNGSTYTSVYTDNNGTITKSGTETWEWNFTKDGTFNYSCTIDGQTETHYGGWHFDGESNSKSVIACIEKNPTQYSSSQYIGYFYAIPYGLKELRNKKMVWTYKEASTSPGYNESIEVEIVFEAK